MPKENPPKIDSTKINLPTNQKYSEISKRETENFKKELKNFSPPINDLLTPLK